jgi:hypothetical protein
MIVLRDRVEKTLAVPMSGVYPIVNCFLCLV